ncbi:MAG: flagellar hook assembly protein FlgD [Oscillospiraceae bacterium]
MANSLGNLSIESTGGAYSKYSNKVVDTTKGDEANSYMDFDSYLKVLAAQMSNQDFNDPMSDSEMLQQMSSYSMLEGIKNMTSQSNISYATNLVGKAVTVNDGYDYDTGIVESVVVTDGTPYLVVNGGKYEVSTVSNVTSADIYNLLSRLIDQEVNIHGATEDEIVASGKVTNVLMLDGNAYVIVDGKEKYPLKDVSLKRAEGSEEGGEGDTSENGTENSESTSDNTTITDTAVPGSEAMSSYITQSDALFSELMSTIDSISGNETQTASVINNLKPNLDGYETVTVTKLDIPNYAAAFIAQYEDLQELIAPSSVLANDSDVISTNMISDGESSGKENSDISTLIANSTSSESPAVSTSKRTLTIGQNDTQLTTSNLYSLARTSRTGNLTPTLTNDQVYNLITSGDYTARYNQKYGLELYSDSKPGISTSDCVPHRIYADEYPEEAALADAIGTRMYDIRFIHNTAITTRVDTSRVIGTTISGREICEIGFCGIGRLGEVVTFKDGKQRVEIMFDNGHSAWLETSGKYTIEEIINQQVGDDVTPFEVALASYAKSASAQRFENLRQNLTSMGVNVVG